MYFNLLTTIGIILITSTFVSLILLLRKNLKQCVKSFIFVLILSDLLSNIFIGVLLLLKQQNITSSEQETEIGILRDYNNDASDNHTNLDDSNECDFTSLLMNYAIVIVPFVNNFVSVLSKSLCCNYNVGCVKNKLKELLSSKKMSSYSTSIEELGSQFRFFKSRSNNIFTIVSIVGQWMVPIVSLMLLYLTGYENINSYVRSYELKCLDMMNFPFDDCYSNISKPEQEQFDGLDTIDALDDISVMNTTDFIFQDDDDDDDNNTLNAVESTATNSSETNKIIFKIQEIVQSALNNSQDIPEWYFSNSISNSSKLELKKTRKINNIEENLLDNEITIKCMKNNKCLIPPNVLKTHMILLIFIIYFGSILLSTVYCIKSNYTCFNIKQHLLAVESMDKVTGDKQESVEDEKDNKNQQPTSSDAIQWTNSCIDVQSAENIKEETCDVEKIIFICKTSVLLAVLLWTPIFIQLIGKIFMCMESYWSMNFFYLAAMSYGVIRNFLNNDMVKTKKIVPQI